jgi:hypothetical protein
VAFADETDHYSREFLCCWGLRPESAEDIARRAIAMGEGLERIAPRFGDLWPLLGMRAARSTDPGPISSMEVRDLAAWIDNKCRFDPPRPPAPVSPEGFWAAFGTRSRPPVELPSGAMIKAGIYRVGLHNRMELDFRNEAPIWRDRDQALAVMHVIAEAWDAEVAAAWAFATSSVDDLVDGGSLETRHRPWLVWTRRPLTLQPIMPPYYRAFPYPFPFEEAGPPSEVRVDGESRLEIWP